MKPYSVQIEVTTLYTVEVHAEDGEGVSYRAWRMDPDEIEAQGSVEYTRVTYVDEENIEEIQRESEEDENITQE